MKLYSLLIAVFAAAIFLPACNKLDSNPGGLSVGTLKDTATGACMPVSVNGIFRVDSVLNNDNYVDVQVNVTIPGTFEIKSDSVNGYSFKKTGTLGTGLNTVRLYASGKPVATGVNTFTIAYGLSSCSFSITVYGAGAGTALYILGGAPNNCSVSSVNGNYVTGLAMTAANTVETSVYVTSIGTYVITGAIVNGVSFSASGVFTNPGVQNIFLKATGIPLAPGIVLYPVTNGATNCNFSITVI